MQKNDVLTSLERALPKLVKGKASLMQIKIMPGAQGFGIDLSEVNTVAGLVKAGKAEAADMRSRRHHRRGRWRQFGCQEARGGSQKGKSSYIFTVIRPAAPSKQDKVNELTDSVDTPDVSDNGVAAKHVPASSSSVESAPTAAPREAAPDEDDPLKRSLAESRGGCKVDRNARRTICSHHEYETCGRYGHHCRVDATIGRSEGLALSLAMEACPRCRMDSLRREPGHQGNIGHKG